MRAYLALLFAGILFALPACLQPRYQLDTSNVSAAANLVMERLERYAAVDTAIAPATSAEIAADVAAARQQLAQPIGDQRVLAPPMLRICERHDAYVAGDAKLLPLERTVYLQSTARLRALLQPP